jgi:hypothetical protein
LRSDVAQGSILHKSKSWMYEDSGLGKEHSTNLSFGGLRAENKSRAPKWSEEERVQVLQTLLEVYEMPKFQSAGGTNRPCSV